VLLFWDIFWDIVKFIIDIIYAFCSAFGSDAISSANTEEQIQKSETAAEEE